MSRPFWPAWTLVGALSFASSAWAAPTPTAQMLRTEGLRLLEAKKLPEAVDALKKAVQDSPDFTEAWIDLGNAHLGQGEYPAAAKAFSGALAVKPDLLLARYNLAFALRKSGDLPRAVETYKFYLNSQPDDADAWYGLAESLRGAGDKIAAASAYEKFATLEKRPDRQNWVAKAKEFAAELRGISPQTAPPPPPPPTVAATGAAPAPPTRGLQAVESPEVARARTLLQNRQFKEALEILRPVALGEKVDHFVASALAAAYLGAGDAQRALSLYEKALATSPVEGQQALYFGIAQAAKVLGNEDAERKALSQVVRGSNAKLTAAAQARLEDL